MHRVLVHLPVISFRLEDAATSHKDGQTHCCGFIIIIMLETYKNTDNLPNLLEGEVMLYILPADEPDHSMLIKRYKIKSKIHEEIVDRQPRKFRTKQ